MPSSAATTIVPDRRADVKAGALHDFQSRLNRGSYQEDRSRRRDGAEGKVGRGQEGRGYRDGGRGNEGLDVVGKEWEEEQVRLDRDWYSYDDEGAVVSANLSQPEEADIGSRQETKSIIRSCNGRGWNAGRRWNSNRKL